MQSRLLTTPNKSQVRTPSQSRIIERKQIDKRLQNLSMKELERISSNLLKQNEKLKEEVSSFSQKVKKLLQSKKYEADFRPNPQVQQQILRQKKQLQRQYEVMKDLKSQIQKENSRLVIEEASTNSKEMKNEIKSIELQIEELQRQKQRLSVAIKDNEIDFEQYLPTRDLTAQTQVFREDNKQLKKKVYNISLQIKENERSAKEALTKIYSLKKQGQILSTSFQLSAQTPSTGGIPINTRMNRIKSLSVLSNHEATRAPPINHLKQLKTLQQQIELLKQKKTYVQCQLEFQKNTKQSAKEKKQKEISDLLEYHKKLFKKRVRYLTELNFLEKKQADLRLQKQLDLEKANVPVAERAMQTQNIIRKQYRKDWIGNNQGIHFDDSELLQYKQSCLIKSLFIYRSTDRIVFIRFGYQHPESKYKYETKVPFDKEGLKKIENKRITSKSNGHLVNLILSVTKNIITRVESLWSDGDSNVQGWETEESSKYRLDIGEKQRPIAFYGTVVPHAKGFYALESLGCQILEKDE